MAVTPKLDDYLEKKEELAALDAVLANLPPGQGSARFVMTGKVSVVVGNTQYTHPALDRLARAKLAEEVPRTALNAIRQQTAQELLTMAADVRAEINALLL